MEAHVKMSPQLSESRPAHAGRDELRYCTVAAGQFQRVPGDGQTYIQTVYRSIAQSVTFI